jgi:acylphosphatase
VQGVNFRDFARREAEHTGLTGFARNLPDGSLEVTVEGRRSLVLHFIEELMSGPPGAKVIATETEWLEPSGAYPDFGIRD